MIILMVNPKFFSEKKTVTFYKQKPVIFYTNLLKHSIVLGNIEFCRYDLLIKPDITEYKSFYLRNLMFYEHGKHFFKHLLEDHCKYRNFNFISDRYI